MKVRPINLQLDPDGRLIIEWSDGERRKYGVKELRDACPCATCRERRAQEEESPQLFPILSPAETEPLKLMEMKPVGNYAYGIHFSDGHDTGIFTFEFLRQLGEELA